jgi:protein involved in polysaccharide export with SLBB domain
MSAAALASPRAGWLLAWVLAGLAWHADAGAQPAWGVAPQPTANASAPGADPALTAAEAPAPEYRISRGDDLDLRFFYVPELNTRAQVRSDGRISVPLIGEMAVDGLTVGELARRVQEGLADQVKRPQVAINVMGGSTLRIFVGGEVGKPGMQPLSGPMTALQAVMVAEGVKDTAQPSLALVLRGTPQGERLALPVDLDAAMKGEKPDVLLKPFDVVVVPRSGIADIGRWVDLYIRRTLPISFGISYNYDGTGVSR